MQINTDIKYIPFGATLMSCPALKESSSSLFPLKSYSALATKWSSSPEAQAFTNQREVLLV